MKSSKYFAFLAAAVLTAGAYAQTTTTATTTTRPAGVDKRQAGGALYLQYWFYYPESFSGGIGRIFGHSWPGYHPDDWKGV